MAYGGHNETIGPYWVAIDRGLYQKHGIDARLLQVRNAQILHITPKVFLFITLFFDNLIRYCCAPGKCRELPNRLD